MKEITWLERIVSDLRWWLAYHILGYNADTTDLLPIRADELPGVWVPMTDPAYAALIPFGFPPPDEGDASTEPAESLWDLIDDCESVIDAMDPNHPILDQITVARAAWLGVTDA